jgi:hypothetical protein
MLARIATMPTRLVNCFDTDEILSLIALVLFF